jgi:hypothetical protein
MDTNQLIKVLAADSQRSPVPLSRVWWSAAGLAGTLAALLVFATLSPRSDIVVAAETSRFLFKLVFALALVSSAFGVIRALSRPGEGWRKAMPYLAAAPALLATAVIIELLVLPPDAWSVGMMGANGPACLISLLLIGLGPLAVILATLRHGAPTRPTVAGTVAGLLAGGITAIFYTIHCPDDSPLFVATWYTIAIASLAIIGAAAGRRLIRW